MSSLIIVESPTKARTLSKFLGKDYVVEATMGHIKDLPKSKISVDVEHDFEPDYQVVDDKKKYISVIKKAAKSADIVYIATDPDREGEAIAQHVVDILNGKKHSRITFHEITKEAVEHAISDPSEVNRDRVDAQIARRVLDRLVGYKLSPLLWKKIRRGLSAGRVQTVCVRLIVEREREIEAFKPVEYWEIYAEVTQQGKKMKGESFIVKLAKIDGKKAEVSDKKTADKVVGDLKASKYKVLDIKKREVKKRPYAPFTTSTMTQASANLSGWSSKKTMSTAQKLYEEGLITYHRTDSVTVAKKAVETVRAHIIKSFGKQYAPDQPRVYKTKSKSAQEAHEAIRPTDVSIIGDSFKVAGRFADDAEKLYGLIYNRFVASQMSDAIYDSTTIEVEANAHPRGENSDTPGVDKGGKYILRVSGQTTKFDGWRKIIPQKASDEPELPSVEKDDPLDLIKLDPQQKFTKPPARFNEASLIKTLESLGIGRPSTYAPTISTIQLRNYVEKKDKAFNPTVIGITVNDFLVGNFDKVFDYGFTAGMEDSLDSIAQGKLKWQKMMGDFYTPFEKKVVSVEEKAKRVAIPVEKIGKKCPTCPKEGRKGKKQGDLVIRTGRFGKFISCALFPECKHTEKYLVKVDGMKCPDCKEGDVVVKRTKSRRTFYGCSRYPDCEFASWTKPGEKEDGGGKETAD